MIKKRISFLVLVFLVSSLGILFLSCSKKETGNTTGKVQSGEKEILHWTCGMHPSIKVSPEEYKKGTKQCPICHMDLVPVYPKESKKEEMMPSVQLNQKEILLTGVATQEVGYHHLMKEIVTVGKIAYDPELTIAEEEYITTLNAYEDILKSNIPESIERTKKLVSQTEYRLRLLGLGTNMIEALKKTKKVHTNLILPEDKVWVYADVYELELGWVKEGQEVEVEAVAYPGDFFSGKIKSIDTVLNPKTRSVRVRAEIKNDQLKLKLDMYVKVKIKIHLGEVLSVPKDAVLDTGIRKVVYVDSGNGEYIMREVVTGSEAVVVIDGIKERFYPVSKGLSKGELVVTRANFLIDSQSQITGSGSAEAVYGGALEGAGKEKMPAGHQH